MPITMDKKRDEIVILSAAAAGVEDLIFVDNDLALHVVDNRYIRI